MTEDEAHRTVYGAVTLAHLADQPMPPEEINTRDPQSAVDRCLNCTAKQCFGTCGPYEGVKERAGGRKRRLAVDAKVEAMLEAGYGNYPICRELQITEKELRQARARINYYRRKKKAGAG